MRLGLEGARVLVTGGAANIGRAIVHGFAAEHARVLVCDVDRAQGEKVVAEAGELGAAEADLVVGDLAVAGAGTSAIERMLAAWGGVDVLVNNVGWTVPAMFVQDTDRVRWQRIVDVNLFAAVEISQAAVVAMRDAGHGSVVFVASDAAFGQVRQGLYGAAKAGLVALARTIAKEHGRHHVRVNVIAPGVVLPADADAVGERSLWAAGTATVFDDRQLESVLRATPLGALATATDVANAVLWFASDLVSGRVTGQVISVDGGFVMP